MILKNVALRLSVTERVCNQTRGSIPLEKKNVGRIKQLGLDRLPFLEQAKNESVSTLPELHNKRSTSESTRLCRKKMDKILLNYIQILTLRYWDENATFLAAGRVRRRSPGSQYYSSSPPPPPPPPLPPDF